jgi:hypothetical protein
MAFVGRGMTGSRLFCAAWLALWTAGGLGQTLQVPRAVAAGSAVSISSTGSGPADVYIVGPAQVLHQKIQLGATITIPQGTLYAAGRYLAILSGESVRGHWAFDVTPSADLQKISFLARPSRLPVGQPNGVSGTVYLFDAYGNLMLHPVPVSFEYAAPGGAPQQRTVTTRDGVASVEMNSSSRQGNANFVARAGSVTSTRVVEQVPGDPCSLRMTAQPAGNQILLKTDPVRDCSGNAVPDGTIVTFTETRDNQQTTVDVPLKQGVAQVTVPSVPGARISLASGVVLGNEIRWNR